jgi:hypothetical protein
MEGLFSKISFKATNIHKTEKRVDRSTLVKNSSSYPVCNESKKIKDVSLWGYSESYPKDRKKFVGKLKIAAKHLAIATDKEGINCEEQ